MVKPTNYNASHELIHISLLLGLLVQIFSPASCHANPRLTLTHDSNNALLSSFIVRVTKPRSMKTNTMDKSPLIETDLLIECPFAAVFDVECTSCLTPEHISSVRHLLRNVGTRINL